MPLRQASLKSTERPTCAVIRYELNVGDKGSGALVWCEESLFIGSGLLWIQDKHKYLRMLRCSRVAIYSTRTGQMTPSALAQLMSSSKISHCHDPVPSIFRTTGYSHKIFLVEYSFRTLHSSKNCCVTNSDSLVSRKLQVKNSGRKQVNK